MVESKRGETMAKANEKTNVMRILEQKKIPYTAYCYLDSGVVSGPEVAEVLKQDPARVYKTGVAGRWVNPPRPLRVHPSPGAHVRRRRRGTFTPLNKSLVKILIFRN